VWPGLERPGLLPREFFDRSAVETAPSLLGCVLEHETPEGLVAARLTEVEAYEGEADPASHAYRGRTRRNGVMFGPPGHAYVYFTYGMHFCVNLVCASEDTACAVLLRSAAIVAGEALARWRRSAEKRAGAGQPAASAGADGRKRASLKPASDASVQDVARLPAGRDLARGPARLCQALGIDRSLDGVDVCDPGSPLRIRAAASPRPARILCGPRVGVSAAASVPWRFWIAGEPAVSAYRAHTPRRVKPSAAP
jgi:DNA-3-methyladenine glycosylase